MKPTEKANPAAGPTVDQKKRTFFSKLKRHKSPTTAFVILLEEGFKEDLIQLHEVVGLAFQMGLKKGQAENIRKQQDLLRAAEQCGRQQLTMELGLDDPEFQALLSLFTELKSKIKYLESDLEDLRCPSFPDPRPNYK
jgi:hypothetical protein